MRFDNGGEKFSNLGEFKGKKGYVYEGGIRVPTYIRFPGVIAPNQVNDQVIITHDITATILAATNTLSDPNYPLDGENLLPIIKGETPIHPRTLFWRYKGIDTPVLPPKVLQGAVRSAEWKYVKTGDKEFLFNLATDSKEEIDLQFEYVSIFEQLRPEYQKWESELEPYST